ncbi:hypothetical protein D1818_04545 [Aquimarina sp. BL5]|nr:hypothetical protein D1818_04545 [Aquimarina sp. BL5]RKN03340.1 hypothetical protein D7036_14125 [Aquimarina sp. BL5]
MYLYKKKVKCVKLHLFKYAKKIIKIQPPNRFFFTFFVHIFVKQKKKELFQQFSVNNLIKVI